jgi:hypothetical protein
VEIAEFGYSYLGRVLLGGDTQGLEVADGDEPWAAARASDRTGPDRPIGWLHG